MKIIFYIKKHFHAGRRQLLVPEKWIRDHLFLRCNTPERTWSIPAKILLPPHSLVSVASVNMILFVERSEGRKERSTERCRKKDQGKGTLPCCTQTDLLCVNRLTVPLQWNSSSTLSLLLLQTLHYFTGPSLDLLQYVHVSLLLEIPEADPARQMCFISAE